MLRCSATAIHYPSSQGAQRLSEVAPVAQHSSHGQPTEVTVRLHQKCHSTQHKVQVLEAKSWEDHQNLPTTMEIYNDIQNCVIYVYIYIYCVFNCHAILHSSCKGPQNTLLAPRGCRSSSTAGLGCVPKAKNLHMYTQHGLQSGPFQVDTRGTMPLVNKTIELPLGRGEALKLPKMHCWSDWMLRVKVT